MRTRRHERPSALLFDPEIEKTVRHNRQMERNKQVMGTHPPPSTSNHPNLDAPVIEDVVESFDPRRQNNQPGFIQTSQQPPSQTTSPNPNQPQNFPSYHSTPTHPTSFPQSFSTPPMHYTQPQPTFSLNPPTSFPITTNPFSEPYQYPTYSSGPTYTEPITHLLQQIATHIPSLAIPISQPQFQTHPHMGGYNYQPPNYQLPPFQLPQHQPNSPTHSNTSTASNFSDENEDGARPLKLHYRPGTYDNPAPIVLRQGGAFPIAASFIGAIPKFLGHGAEDPYVHLDDFCEIANAYHAPNRTIDDIRLRLFPFSLQEDAKRWYLSLPSGSITTWAQMQEQFLQEYYSVGRTTDARDAILKFKTLPGEAFHAAFHRFKKLLRACPHHNVPLHDQVKAFYDSLDSARQDNILAASGGQFFNNGSQYGWNLLVDLVEGDKSKSSSNRRQHHPVNSINGSDAVMKDEIFRMNQKLDHILSTQEPGSGHASRSFEEEGVNMVYGSRPSQNNPFSNNYNPATRDRRRSTGQK